MLRPRRVYASEGFYQLVIFDVRLPGVAQSLHRQRAAFGEYGDVESLDQDHFVLIVYPGSARRSVA